MINLLAAETGTPMSTIILIFGIVVIVMSVFLIIAVLMQQGKQHNISGTIAGAADTFFGKTKGSTISKKLSVLTSVVAIIFVILVLAYYIIATPNKGDTANVTEDSAVETTVDTAEETAAESAEETETAAESETDAETNE